VTVLCIDENSIHSQVVGCKQTKHASKRKGLVEMFL
jgi:hypothetical protein